MTRPIALALLVLALAGCGGTGARTLEPAEDSPAFRCWEHGNGLCGRPGGSLIGTQLLANA